MQYEKFLTFCQGKMGKKEIIQLIFFSHFLGYISKLVFYSIKEANKILNPLGYYIEEPIEIDFDKPLYEELKKYEHKFTDEEWEDKKMRKYFILVRKTGKQIKQGSPLKARSFSFLSRPFAKRSYDNSPEKNPEIHH